MKKSCKCFILVVILCSMTILISLTTYANSAEPPSLVILINNPPADLSIVLVSSENRSEAKVKRVAWEGYYVFYSSDMRVNGNYKFIVTSNGESFECTFNEPIKRYNKVLTLDMSTQEFTPGEYPFRSVILVAIRLLITLLLEGIIFWLFGFRRKRSWIVFIVINLITQGALNIWLNNVCSLMSSYLIFTLIFGEFFVFLTEMIMFPILINEHKKRAIIYSLVANIVSLIAGGYLITVLPI
ncbi:hypothetical protein SH1V18_19570 [Vallitalea longa]|uniref:Uncharacterized protein n=1 Tax=Vallitalea longa TaxID=2936439 RepID=A0A9W6DFH3_9FIRM|nr:hypothetical protein [Vallitalea longa]GKX29477.1 hypothetical protein SH1V18_19570 [Vallitalea longa]